MEGPLGTPRHWGRNLAIWPPDPSLCLPDAPPGMELEERSGLCTDAPAEAGTRHVPGCLPRGQQDVLITGGSEGAQTALSWARSQQMLVSEKSRSRKGRGCPPRGSPEKGQEAGAQARQRDAQEGFLEEGPPTPKLEEHTVPTGSRAPSRPRGGGEVCAAVRAPSPGEVSGVGGPVGETEEVSVGRA